MKKVLVVCLGGFSSSVFASKLKKAAVLKGLDYETMSAFPGDGKKVADQYDVILISPQAFHEARNFNAIHSRVIDIPPLLYGTMDGDKAIELIEDFYNKEGNELNE